MSLIDYDKSFYKKIKNLYDEVLFASPEEAFKTNAKMHKGKVLMPFIALWRLPDFSVNREMYNDSYVRRGPKRIAGGSKGVEFPNDEVCMHGLPVTLTYQIDIYATKREICDGLTAELMLEFFENPWVNVHQSEMGEDFVEQFNVDIEDNVSDNTDISGFDETNRFYRLSITASITEALIYRISKSDKPFDKVMISFDDLDWGLRDIDG